MTMANYTQINLSEVENMAPQFGMPPGMEARFARSALGLERTGLTLFRLEPGVRIPFGHRHEHHEEVYVVVSGSARIKIGDDVLELGPLQAVHVPGDTMRNLQGGPDGAEVLAFGAPDTDNKDAEMVPGWWSD